MAEDLAIAARKRSVRKRLALRRSALSAADRTAAVEAFGGIIAAQSDCLSGKVIAAYAPVGSEPGSLDLLDQLIDVGARVLLPITRGLRDPLDWGWYEGRDGLGSGPIGLLQPRAVPGLTLRDADWVLVPALAVDRRGVRIGKGAGHYDRALVGVPAERLVVVVYDSEVVEELPAEYHDLPVGWIVSPQAGLRRV